MNTITCRNREEHDLASEDLLDLHSHAKPLGQSQADEVAALPNAQSGCNASAEERSEGPEAIYEDVVDQPEPRNAKYKEDEDDAWLAAQTRAMDKKYALAAARMGTGKDCPPEMWSPLRDTARQGQLLFITEKRAGILSPNIDALFTKYMGENWADVERARDAARAESTPRS